MRRIYVTHCSHKKDNSLENTGKQVTPDKLYTATPTKRFMQKCKNKGVDWAIFSDEYGVWFPEIKHIYYDKDPNAVNPEEFERLVKDFENKLNSYDEIYFYHNPGRLHRLYKELLGTVKIRNKIIFISHLYEIG